MYMHAPEPSEKSEAKEDMNGSHANPYNLWEK
jgi:hypothetical protein